MADVKWIKISTNIFNDEKILLIESMPDAEAIIVIWFKVLVLAGNANNRGYLTINDTLPYNDEMLSAVFRMPLSTVRMALKVFEQFDMIEYINDTICVVNWEKHQNVEGLERIREQNRERKRRQREREKTLLLEDTSMSRDMSREVTQQNKNKNKNKNKKDNNTPAFEEEFERLWSLYPNKKGKEAAKKKYITARKEGVSLEEIESGIIAYAHYVTVMKTEKQFVKHGSTFFSQRSWADDWSVNENTRIRERSAGFTGEDFSDFSDFEEISF